MEKRKTIKRANLRWANLFVAVLLLCGWMANSLAKEGQEGKMDLNALTHETQRMTQKADEMTLVWWIPEEFWWATFAQNPTMTKTQTEEFVKVLRPYTFIAVVDGKIGAFGGVTYRTEAEIRAGTQIKDRQGARYRPLSEDKLDADTKNFLSMMKPILVNMLGPLGQNMHFLLFPAKDKNGQNIADAKKEGAFSVELGERRFRWRLPLSSLFPPKICSKCQEKCSGVWNYCPWCGTKLPK